MMTNEIRKAVKLELIKVGLTQKQTREEITMPMVLVELIKLGLWTWEQKGMNK